MKRYKNNRHKGRSNKAAGDAFEHSIEATFELLAVQRRAVCFKVPNPVAIHGVSERGRVSGSIAAAVWTDFAGVQYHTGLAMAFEAKVESGKTSFAFAKIRDIQMTRLRQTASAGGIAFLLVRRVLNEMRARDYVMLVNANGDVAGVSHKRAGTQTGLVRESITWAMADDLGLAIKPNETWHDALVRVRYEALKSNGGINADA